ncbi:MAG: tyrosine-type recombinase/integrase [Devosia sp.]
MTIGAYGIFTLDQGRDAARETLRTMRMGDDPRYLRRQEAVLRITLREVADIYIARPGMLKETTKSEMKRHVELMWGEFLHKPIAAITSADVRRRYDDVATKGIRGGGPAPVQASIATVTLRTLINFARTEYTTPEGRPFIEYNPVSILKRELRPSPPRTRHIERRRVGEFWDFLCRLRQIPWSDDAQTGTELVMFLLLTGARRNEGAKLTWDRVNLDASDPTNCWWHLPDPKNRHPVWLPLSSQAAAILSSRKGKGRGTYVFNSRSKLGHITDTRAPLERFSKAIGMSRLSPHDLRRTFVTLGAKACRLDIAKLELLTNHVPQGITARHYLETSDLRDYLPEVQAIADWIESEGRLASTRGDSAFAIAYPAASA